MNIINLLRRIAISLGIAGIADRIWSAIYPHTPLCKKRVLALRRMFSRNGFVKPSDLVFDIGAKDGMFTDVFLSLGARAIVAVEPETSLARKLMADNVHSLNVALGSHNHYADYFVGVIKGVSTLSKEQMVSERFSSFKWKKPINIYVTTLDKLKDTYGEPSFIKIDVERYETEVIKGMNFAPKGIMFEFIPEDIHSVLLCIGRIDSLGDYEYNYTQGMDIDMKFEMENWDTSYNMVRHIRANVPDKGYGDIWARLTKR